MEFTAIKNTYRNGIVLALAVCFLALNFIGEAASARQTKNSKKATPTPAKKASTKDMKPVAAKATPAPKAKTATASKANAKPTPKPSKTLPKTKSNAAAATAKKEKSDSSVKTASVQKPKQANAASAKKDASPSSKKNTRQAAPKTVGSSKPTATIAKTGGGQIIVVTTDARIRQQPKTNAPQLNVVKIGKLLNVSEKNGSWYRVEYENERSGWLSNTVARSYESDNRDEIYQAIADRYAKNKSLDFAAAAEVSDFLRTAQALAKKDAVKADMDLKRLQILAAALRAIPGGKGGSFPYKSFLQSHEKEVVYSEPSATWLVRSDLFWELHNKYMQLPIAEDIAWVSARNDIPGECEGYINCQLYRLRAMEGEYLNFYPDGKYSKQALELVTANLNVMVANMNDKTAFTPLADISDRAEFNRFLTELRTIISKISDADKAKPLQYINQLGEGYK